MKNTGYLFCCALKFSLMPYCVRQDVHRLCTLDSQATAFDYSCLLLLPGSRKRTVHKPWSAEERSAVHGFLLKDFSEEKPFEIPGKTLIDSCIKSNPCLSGRSSNNIKDYVRNYIVKDGAK